MPSKAAKRGMETPDLQLVTDTVGFEEEESNKCDAAKAQGEDQECAQRPDIPPVGLGRTEDRWPRNPRKVPEFLRAEAAGLREYGGDSIARTLDQAAKIMEWAQMVWDNEPLTLQQAAEESGYSYSALEKKLASGELENVGEKGRPRLRRGDSPRKGLPPYRAERPGEPDPVGDLFLRKLGA